MKNKALQKVAPALHRILYRDIYIGTNSKEVNFSEEITPYYCEGCPFGMENPDEEHLGISTYNKALYLCSIRLSKQEEENLGAKIYVNPDDPACTEVDWINKAQEELELLSSPNHMFTNTLGNIFNEYYKEEATALYNKFIEVIYENGNDNKTIKEIRQEVLADASPKVLESFERLLKNY